jgi:hypothetical protein
VRTSYENLTENDRVYATVKPNQSQQAAGGKKKKRVLELNHSAYNSPTVFFDDECKRYPAEITKVR